MNGIYTLSLMILAVAGVLCLARVALGPSMAARIVASDTLVLVVVASLAVGAARSRSGLNASVLVVVALVGFLGTSFLARFIEKGSGRE
ncbi:MAG TPA: monovalent cation/H+ antiporter complex subunit F [Actinomycetota bacterium]|nr:monovalent cation/H+ antiporter complex subunit F [Actinomycetota bacterium]